MDLITPMRTFVKAAETGSFAAAADALDLSPQLVGKHVQSLEHHLGVKLLNRNTRRQSLTDFGDAFLERARVILEELEDTERLAETVRGRPVGRLRVNAPVSFGTRTLTPKLVDFMLKNPDITVDLKLTNDLVDVVNDGYDIVFRVGELADSNLIGRQLGSYPLVLCAAPTRSLCWPQPREIGDRPRFLRNRGLSPISGPGAAEMPATAAIEFATLSPYP
jgi:DNA-binding transcriptional LysR family regulator